MTTSTNDRAHADDLDRFETALLTELRGVVARHKVVRRRKRVLTLGGVAASAAAALGVSLAVGGTSPAFAVHREADGDVSVTINRLDDAHGLEQALADKGIAATVRYQGATVDTDPAGRFDPHDLPPGPHHYTDADCKLMAGQRISVDPDGRYHLLITDAAVRTGDPVTLLVAGSSPATAQTLVAVGNQSSGCAVQTGPVGAPTGNWLRWTPDATRALG